MDLPKFHSLFYQHPSCYPLRSHQAVQCPSGTLCFQTPSHLCVWCSICPDAFLNSEPRTHRLTEPTQVLFPLERLPWLSEAELGFILSCFTHIGFYKELWVQPSWGMQKLCYMSFRSAVRAGTVFYWAQSKCSVGGIWMNGCVDRRMAE